MISTLQVQMNYPNSKIRPTVVIMLLGLLTSFAPFATDTYLAGFSDIAASLNCQSSDVQLSLSSFFLGLSLGQIFYGPISDRIGRKIPLLTGVFVFTLTSLIAIFSPDIKSFVIIRFLQAVGGCGGMILSRAIIRDLFTQQESARALSLLMVVMSLGPIIAPILGGFILSFTTWHGIFIFLVVLGLFCLLATFVYIPETLPTEQRDHGNISDVPKVFLQLLKNRQFIIPSLASGVAMSAMFIFISGSPYVFMEIHGIGQQAYGYLFGLNAVGMIITSSLNRFFLKKFTSNQVFIGALSFALVMSGCAVFLADTSSLPLLIIPLFAALSMIPVLGANGVAVAMAATGKNAGSGSSLIGVLQFGIASLASSLVSLLHNETAYPMTGLICVASFLGMVIYLLGRERETPPQPAD